MSTGTLTGQISQKLPFWSTLENAYAFWAKNLRELLRLSWLWFAVTAPVLTVFWWWDLPYYNASMQATRAHHPDPTPILTLALGGLRYLIGVPMTASIAVAWHRLLLRSERCGTATYLRFDRIVIGYVVLSVMLDLILLVTSSIDAMARYFWPTSDLQTIGIGGISGIAFYVFARLTVCLPAKALDRQEITLAEVWSLSNGSIRTLRSATLPDSRVLDGTTPLPAVTLPHRSIGVLCCPGEADSGGQSKGPR